MLYTTYLACKSSAMLMGRIEGGKMILIPYKYSKLDTKTGKTYEHTYTEKEKQEMKERLQNGEKMGDIMKSFRERLTDKDWVEV